MSDATGGRTQVTGIAAAGAIAVVLLFFTGPLRYVPIPALGAVLVKAGMSLVDIEALKTIYRIDRREFVLSSIATLGVVAVGAIQAILFVVALATLRFVRLVARPKVEILGRVEGFPGLHSVERHPEATTIPGLLLLRFNAPIVFFNAPYFKRELLAAVDAAGPSLRWVVLDMLPITMIDATGLQVAQEIAEELDGRDAVLVAAGRQTEWRRWAEKRGFEGQFLKTKTYPTLRVAMKTFLATTAAGNAAQRECDPG
jgi:MFS superfamily sulfate permease-like transporter